MKKGQRVTMTDNAVENYGEQYRGVTFIITHTATKYMPAEQFYAMGRPNGYHPGYDESSGQTLHDLAFAEDGCEFPNSLYTWELTRA